MKLFLYRTSDNDGEGDPIDFGVVQSATEKKAIVLVAQHLIDLFDEEKPPMEFKIYELDVSKVETVLSSRHPTVHQARADLDAKLKKRKR